MIEIPESMTLTRQLSESFLGKSIAHVEASHAPHKFAWYNPEPEEYPLLLTGKKLSKVNSNGGQVELVFEDMHVVLNDGATPRYLDPADEPPKKHQLLVRFEDGNGFVCTVRMYGGMMIYPYGKTDNEYYLASRDKPSPLTDEFTREYFQGIINAAENKLSAKALLATEQRIPGLGNGVLQDILYNALVHPQKKLSSMTEVELDTIFACIKDTLRLMSDQRGRDVEKDLYGASGGYKTILSSKTKDEPCSRCGSLIVRKAYMGGNVYFCPTCQPL